MSKAILGLLASLAACHVPSESPSGIPEPLTARSQREEEERGAAIYAVHCAVCHGAQGRADGAAAPYLFPPARDFAKARFRLVSARNGAPFDRDLVATLRRGIPGSAMPAWSWLPEEDLWALASHVRALARNGLAAELEAQAQSSGVELSSAAAGRLALARTTPDAPIVPPPVTTPSEETLALGREVYLATCAGCHAPDGKGEREPRRDEDGTLNWARDFTAGFLKGGDAPGEIACRIRAGMPGSAMPPTALDPAQEGALIAYVRSLIPEGTAGWLVHARATLRARRVNHVPSDPDDPLWSEAEEIGIVLAPLWWHEDAAHEASLAGLHDGETLALRLRWNDETGGIRIFAGAMPVDAAALQISSAAAPALFGMGSEGEPTEIWHWQALRLEEADALDLLDPRLHAAQPTRPGEVRADVPIYQRLLDLPAVSAQAERIPAEGIESVARASRFPGEVQAHTRWKDREWSVIFARGLDPDHALGNDHVALAAGRRVQVACAVWNGAAGDEGARKSISIWQELVIEP